MYRIIWINLNNGKTGYCSTSKGLRTYESYEAADKAARKFTLVAPFDIIYKVEKSA